MIRVQKSNDVIVVRACAVGFSEHEVFLLLIVTRHVCCDHLSWCERSKGPNVSSNNPDEQLVLRLSWTEIKVLFLIGFALHGVYYDHILPWNVADVN